MPPPSIHRLQAREMKTRALPAAVALAIVALIVSTWTGLFTFLGMAASSSLVDQFEGAWLPEIDVTDIAQLPNLSSVSELFSADGAKLAQLSGRLSQPVRLEDIPPILQRAVISAEDGDFYEHNGVDFEAVARAMVANLRGTTTQGASTITQQVVRGQRYVGREETVLRKLHEMRFAAEMEKRYTKDQILEFYLNSVYFGWNAYGVKAAAQEYFGKDLSGITLPEAAMLATLVRNPTLYDPRGKNAPRVGERRNDVLGLMREAGYITASEAAAAMATPLQVIQHQTLTEPAPQVRILSVRQLLNDPEFAVLGATTADRQTAIFGCPQQDEECEGRSILKGGLKIFTTVDLARQDMANAILRDWFPINPEGTSAPTGAILLLDNQTGAIKVMASGLDFGTDYASGQRDYDIATEGQRQPGSSFKPFALVAYLRNGGSMNSHWNSESPITLDCDVPCGPRGEFRWKVGNADGDGGGKLLPLTAATINSVNTVYAQVALTVGPAAIKETAHLMGVKSDIPEVFSLALGAGEVSPLDMATGYATLANYGRRVDSYLIDRIEAPDGQVIYQHQPTQTEVLPPALAGVVVDAMRSVVSQGTGTRANLPDRQEAGKTGTNQSYRDAWFVGFVPQYTAAVWVGHADAQIELRNVTIKGQRYTRVFGGSVPAPIWREFMTAALAGVPAQDFPPIPPGAGAYRGTPSTVVPDVMGLDLRAAKSKIQTAHLALVETSDYSNEPIGLVFAQAPPAGTGAAHGSAVTVTISLGPAPVVAMPNLVGYMLAEIPAVMANYAAQTGIQLQPPTPVFQVTEPASWDRVYAQDPLPGAGVDSGTQLIIYVGKPA